MRTPSARYKIKRVAVPGRWYAVYDVQHGLIMTRYHRRAKELEWVPDFLEGLSRDNSHDRQEDACK